MKYQQLLAFEKHLEQAAKVQLSRVFLVVSSCPYERKKIVEKIVQAIRSKEKEIHVQVEEGSQGALEDKLEGLNTHSLLQGKQILYLDGIDKLKKQGLSLLAEYVAHPSPFAYLILGASSAKSLTELYTKGKKELIACDLSDEKPWDRKDRLKRFLIDYVAKVGKKWQAEAVEHLLEHVGLTLPGLEQEADKLITYVGERRELTLSDVLSLCAAQKSSTIWQMAETIVWRDTPFKTDEALDLSGLLPLISQLRTQLQQGFTLSILLEKKLPWGEIAPYFPSVKPAALDKMVPVCKARQSPFFKRALDVLFDVELMAKNSSFEPALILDLFVTKLTVLKHALSSAQSSR